MRVSVRRVVLAGMFVLCASAASAQNLIPNSTFDTDLTSWLSAGPIAWNSQDANGSNKSGSVQITNVNPVDPFIEGSGLYSPCIVLPPASQFSFGGKFLIPTGAADKYGSVVVFWHANSDCSDIGITNSSSPNATSPGSWQTVAVDGIAPPAGAVAAQLAGFVYKCCGLVQLVGYFDDAFLIKGSVTAPCVADDTTLCLNGGRYKVTARWRSHSDSGDGHAGSLTSDTGTFWFFSSNNIEMILKVVNACVDPFNHYWVFIAGLTDVEVTVTVVDTETGEVRTYFNPIDHAFLPRQDTFAFATCP